MGDKEESVEELREKLERLEFEKEYAYENMESLQKDHDDMEKSLRIERNLRRDIEHICHSHGIQTPSSDPEEKVQGALRKKKELFEEALLNEHTVNEMKKEVEAIRQQNAKLKRRMAKEYMENAHLQTTLLALEKKLREKHQGREGEEREGGEGEREREREGARLKPRPTHDSIVRGEGGEGDERNERKREREERRIKRNLEVAKLKLEESEEKRKMEKDHHQKEIARLKEEHEQKVAALEEKIAQLQG